VCSAFSPSAVPSIDRAIIGSARQDGPNTLSWYVFVALAMGISRHKAVVDPFAPLR
jgi:hypothetical protein